jgi:inner membrane protein
MDNLTHTLFGATLARTPLGRAGRGATAALILASNAPDIDVVTTLEGAVSYLQWHRGPTHGPLGVVGLGLVVAGLVWIGSRVLDRTRTATHARFASLTAISIAGVLCHVLMDLPTSYGTRLFSPFDWHWFAADLMPIIDIYLLSVLAACLWFGNRLEWRRRNVIIALTLMALNYGGRIIAHRQALAAAPGVFGPTMPERCDAATVQGPFLDRWPSDRPLSERDAARRCLLEIAALPTFVSPFQWRLIAQLSNAYETRDVDLFARAGREPPSTPAAPWRTIRRIPNRWTAAALHAATAETARTFLGFSRFPVVRVSTQPGDHTIVRWNDLRFTQGAPGGRVDEQRSGLFTATVVLAPDGRIVDHRLGR